MHRREGRTRVSCGVTLLGATLAVGCGVAARSGSEPPSAPRRPPSEAERLLELAEQDWGERHDPDALARAIAAWNHVTHLDPGRTETLVRIAQAQHFLGHTLDVAGADPPETVAHAFTDGTQAAERALDTAESDASPDPADPLARERVRSHAQYWRALNLRAWAGVQGYVTEITTQDEVERALTACFELDPDYDHAGPDRQLGTYYARPPTFAARDLARAQEHLQRALQRAPDYFATRVAVAEHFTVATQSRERFETELRRVLEADADAVPEIAPENRLAQQRALDLFYRADEFFE
jgi:tetratricopeptide (TPR) repeat protein